jgi:hypothetical protein
MVLSRDRTALYTGLGKPEHVIVWDYAKLCGLPKYR